MRSGEVKAAEEGWIGTARYRWSCGRRLSALWPLHPWDSASGATRGHWGSGSPNGSKAGVWFEHLLPVSPFGRRKVGLLGDGMTQMVEDPFLVKREGLRAKRR